MKTILLVEDNPAHTMLIKNALLEFNGRTRLITAETGVEALSMLVSDKPDLVVLDLNMPTMNGFEFLEEKKHLAKPFRFVPVIVLTTSPLKRDIWASYELGAAAYIVKPQDYKSFKNVACYLLGFYRLARFPNEDTNH